MPRIEFYHDARYQSVSKAAARGCGNGQTYEHSPDRIRLYPCKSAWFRASALRFEPDQDCLPRRRHDRHGSLTTNLGSDGNAIILSTTAASTEMMLSELDATMRVSVVHLWIGGERDYGKPGKASLENGDRSAIVLDRWI